MTRFVSTQPLKKLIKRLAIGFFRTAQKLVECDLPKFGNNPNNLTIELPRRISAPERMFVGDDVSLGPGAFLVAKTHHPTPGMRHPDRDQLVQTSALTVLWRAVFQRAGSPVPRCLAEIKKRKA